MKLGTYEYHKAKGATFEDFFGIEVPSHYGNYQEEYWGLRKGVALRDVSYFGKVRISGKDRQRFINSMVSNEIKELKPGEGAFAVFLDVKGHLQGDMKFYTFPDHLLMILQHNVKDKIVYGLDRYVLSEDVSMKDVTEEYSMFQILGPQSESFLHSRDVTNLPTKLYSFVSTTIAEREASIIRLAVGYAILTKAEDATKVLDYLQAPLAGAMAFNTFRVESGLALMHRDMDESNFPQEARLDAALNFNKGCYLGQEVMARIDAQGHVNRRLMGLVCKELPKPGDRIYKESREIGKITSAVHSLLLNQPFAIGYVRREFGKDGEQVIVGENNTTAVVRDLPLNIGGRFSVPANAG